MGNRLHIDHRCSLLKLGDECMGFSLLLCMFENFIIKVKFYNENSTYILTILINVNILNMNIQI